MNNPFCVKAVLFDFDGTLTKPGSIDFKLIKKVIGCPAESFILEFIESLDDQVQKEKTISMLENFESKSAICSKPNNGAEIRGMASFIRADNSTFLGIQAGDKFYSVGSDRSFTEIGPVNAAARMRGNWRDGYWALDDKLLITDMTQTQGVMEWDGTTLQPVTFKNGDDSDFGFFSAKYVKINRERAFFSNVKDASGQLASLVVASEVSNYEKISVSDKPSSAIGEADPFFIQSPDLRSINGAVIAFGRMFFSTKNGSMWQMFGENSQEFGLEPFYEGSNAAGEEAVIWAGNDVYYGKIGTIDSLKGVSQFGDVEATALSNPIKPDINQVTNWTAVYNDRKQRAYFFPQGSSDLWVLHKSLIGSEVSPWSKWNTTLPVAFQPSTVMSCLCPLSGCERVYMGDNDGNVYMLEGDEGTGDCGQIDLLVSRTSKVFRFEDADASIWNVRGFVKYRKKCGFKIVMTLLYGGISAFDEPLTVNVPVPEEGFYWSDEENTYWGSFFYGQPFEGRLVKQRWFADGADDVSEFQVRVEVEGSEAFAISEIFCEFEAKKASAP